jgi:hypothetical protein
VLEGNGSFKSGSIKINSKPTTLNAVTLQKYFEARILDADVDTASSDVLALPSKGVLEFTFLATMLMPGDGKEMPDARMAILSEVISLAQSDFEFSDSFNTLLKGFHLSADQSRTLLRMIPADNASRRVMCVVSCIHKLSNPELRIFLLQELNDSEYQMAKKQLGLTAFSFTPANPTGFYRLDLSKDSEREVALNLLRFKNTQAQTEKKEFQDTIGRMGGKRTNFDRVWRNAVLNGRQFIFDTSFKLPKKGILEVNIVEITKVPRGTQHISNKDLHILIEQEWKGGQDGFFLAKLVRGWSNEMYFSCEQVLKLLSCVTRAELLQTKRISCPQAFKPGTPNARMPETSPLARRHLKSADQASVVNVSETLNGCHAPAAPVPPSSVVSALSKMVKDAQLIAFTTWQVALYESGRTAGVRRGGLGKNFGDVRLDIMTTMFGRLTDWVGFRPLVYDRLDRNDQAELQRRLGVFNLFQEAVVVDFWTLDLSDPEQQRIMQELVHLADLEPGRNFVGVMYRERDFQIPSGWLRSVPDKGVISLHYCRERETCCQVREDFIAKHGAWPEGYTQLHGVEWVELQRLKIIKQKLRDKFPSGQLAFREMDRDGSGSMDRKELAVAMLKCGMWLSPSEVVILMETLDSDGSGDIDEKEFINFWNKSVDLYTGLSVASPVLDRGIPDSLSFPSDSV